MNVHLAITLPGKRVHLGVSGSVSAYRAPDILRNIRRAGMHCSVTLTESAMRFIAPLTFQALEAEPVYTAMFDDPNAPSPFAHLEPGQVMHAMLVAPASATTIARLAHGMADDLLACQALAFTGPLVIAPAMNPKMWQHPATQANLATLQQRGAYIVAPGIGHTACGEVGQGRLAELDVIHATLLKALTEQDMKGRRVLVTMGPTREHWDGLRFWTNPSTGTMGACLATAAWLRGAHVEAVCGPGCPSLPEGIVRHEVESADSMFDAASSLWPAADIGIFTAAVADFKPEQHGTGKFKKSDAPHGLDVHFTPTRDILATLSSARKAEQKVMGFAAESHDIELSARSKLKTKNAHLIVGNLIADGFGTVRNTTFVVDNTGREESWCAMPKVEIAHKALAWLLSL